ncbi:hypothetical protein HDV63DRAFT_415459 [Trichoderma sp. SZMC 28014]
MAMELNSGQQALVRAYGRPYNDITREEKLVYLRFQLERDHRSLTGFISAWRTYEPPIDQSLIDGSLIDQDLPPIDTFVFTDLCNKTVPIYFHSGYSRLAFTLYNYLYPRWFKPFQSEIEHGRFLTKFIAPREVKICSRPITTSLESFIALHKTICKNVHKRRGEYAAAITSGVKDYSIVENHQSYVLQPLFEALILIIHPQDWKGENSSLIGRLPVTMARTGVESGLSSPITFEPIADKIDEYIGEVAVKTSLETAITFVMELEAREIKVFGLQPDPIASWDPDDSFIGWRDIMPYDQIIGPSTRFVDIEKSSGSLQQLKQNVGSNDQQFVDAEAREARHYRMDVLIGPRRSGQIILSDYM